MHLRAAFETALLLLILSAGASLGLAEGNPVPFLLLAVAALHQTIRGWRPVLSAQGLNVAGVVVLLVALIDYTFITRWDLLLTLGHLVVWMQIVRTYQGWREAGIGRFLLLGFMQIVVSAAVTADSTFLFPFVAFVVFAACVLSLYRFEYDGGGRPLRIGPGLLARTAIPAFLALGVAAAIFYSFPRLGAGWLGHSRGPVHSMIGFGDEVDLDGIGDLLDNPTVVMRVASDPVPDSATLWRGRVFGRYTGSRWEPYGKYDRRPRVRAKEVKPTGRTFDLRTVNRRSPKRVGGGVTQTFYLERVVPRVIFAAFDPVSIRYLTRPPRLLLVGEGRTITTAYPRRKEIAYQATSLLPTHEGAADVTYDQIAGLRGSGWLSLDRNKVNVPRIRALAETIVDEAGAEGPYERALAIEAYLRYGGGFEYTLSGRRGRRGAREPIEDFLFHRKEGHCEYFASAMVIMLRSIGIPARLINGFKGGEWFPFGRFYLVRQRHAHAWAEVYFGEDVGWLPMDPTPGGAVDLASAFRSFGGFIAYLKYQWVTRVVTYNAEDQAGVMRWASDLLRRFTAWTRGLTPSSILGIPGAVAWLLFLMALCALAILLRRASARRRGRPQSAVAKVPFYKDLTRILARAGFRRGPGETPMEMARRVCREGGDTWRSILRITAAYYRVRFGGVALSPAETAEINEAIHHLRRIPGH